MKILVLNGSPKAKSDTMHLTNAFVDGIMKSGEHQVENIYNFTHKRHRKSDAFRFGKNMKEYII